MRRKVNYGVYADLIGQYLEYKRSLGFGMTCQESHLGRFDELTVRRGETRVGISKELMDEWSRPCTGESDTTRYLRVSTVKGFSVYLQPLGSDSYVPRLPKFNFSFSPHIYTCEEVSAIFRECDRLAPKRAKTGCVAHLMPALIRMLYGTGIRIGEALGLRHADVDLGTGILWLHGCKNGKDRIVPMSASLTEVCKDYVAYKQGFGMSVEPQAHFFAARNGNACEREIGRYFKTVLFKAGLKQEYRLHDLRHSMASAALARMSSEGMDLYHSLPILMAYLGHQSLRATNHYVRITQEAYPGLLKKVNEIGKYVFPEIYYEPDNDEEA